MQTAVIYWVQETGRDTDRDRERKINQERKQVFKRTGDSPPPPPPPNKQKKCMANASSCVRGYADSGKILGERARLTGGDCSSPFLVWHSDRPPGVDSWGNPATVSLV